MQEAKRFTGMVGGRSVWSKGKTAYVANPEIGKWISVSLRQLLEQGTGYEIMTTSYLDEHRKLVTETKTVRDLIREVKSS